METAEPSRLHLLEELARAASDPFLVILESHPNAEPVANAEMRRAAESFRAALAKVAK